MVWKKTLAFLAALAALSAFTGCEDLRSFEVCKVLKKTDPVRWGAECADGDKEYFKTVPEMDGYFCTNETDFRKIMTRLEECQRENP